MDILERIFAMLIEKFRKSFKFIQIFFGCHFCEQNTRFLTKRVTKLFTFSIVVPFGYAERFRLLLLYGRA